MPRPLHAQRPRPCGEDPAPGCPGLPRRFAQNDETPAKAQWRQVADQLRSRVPKLSAFMDAAEADVLAYIASLAAVRGD